MDFTNERYVRLYVRDTVTWKRLGWDGQTILMHMLRKADRSGVIDLGGIEPWEAPVVLCGAPDDISRGGMARALELGCIVHDGDRLVLPRFIEAQECAQSDAQRQRESRARRGAISRYTPTVTERDLTPSRFVTDCHELSQAVTFGHEPSQPVTPCRAEPYLTVPSVPSEIAHAHEEQAPRQDPEPEGPSLLRLGMDVVEGATHRMWDAGSWMRELERIGSRPASERAVVLATLKLDPWVSENPERATPGHILKHWARYASGKTQPKPIAIASDGTPLTAADKELDAAYNKIEACSERLDKIRRAPICDFDFDDSKRAAALVAVQNKRDQREAEYAALVLKHGRRARRDRSAA